MNGARHLRRKPMAEINVVPYIDVMLVLLVIFMITAPLINQGVEIDLPQAEMEPLPPEEPRTLILEIDRDGGYHLYRLGEARAMLGSEEVRERVGALLQADPETAVVVRADTEVDYGSVIRAMSLLQQAGAPRVGLATRPPDTL